MTELNIKMEQLRVEYRVSAAADLQVLRELAAALRGDERDCAELERIVEILHRLAGGAGVFGLTQLSEQAHDLELDLNDLLAAPLGADYRGAVPEFRAGLARLSVEFIA